MDAAMQSITNSLGYLEYLLGPVVAQIELLISIYLEIVRFAIRKLQGNK